MTNKDIVKGFFVEGYQNHNYNFVLQYVAEDYVDHSPANARSNEEAVGILKLVENMFSDMKIDVLDLIEEDGQITESWGYWPDLYIKSCLENV